MKGHFVLAAIATTTLFSLGAVSTAQAQIIDFETLPDGITTPTDNQALTGSYNIGGTTVNFGFDVDGDLIADLDAILESRNDSLATGGGYTSSGIPDLDLTPTGEGGDFLLRAPSGFNVFDDVGTATPVDFLVTYSGAAVRSVGGQLWDIDGGERYFIEALDANGGLLDSLLTPVVPNGEQIGTFDALPFNFAFTDLSEDIGFVRISGSSRVNGGGFAFDNFDATGTTVDPEDVPEPASLVALVMLGSGLIAVRRQK